MSNQPVHSVDELKRIALRMRLDIVKMIGAAGSGHLGGSLCEPALFAGFHKLTILTCIVDNNRQQLDEFGKNILDPAPVAEKFRAFGWRTAEIDRHRFEQVSPAPEEARAAKDGKPTVVVAH